MISVMTTFIQFLIHPSTLLIIARVVLVTGFRLTSPRL